MDAVTKYCMLKLSCGYEVLAMLENVFSELAKDAYSKEWCVSTLNEVIAESETLNELLATVYNHIQWEILMHINTKSKSRYILQKVSEMLNCDVAANCLCTCFNSDLDNIVVDWSSTVEQNASKLWLYWLNQKYENNYWLNKL